MVVSFRVREAGACLAAVVRTNLDRDRSKRSPGLEAVAAENPRPPAQLDQSASGEEGRDGAAAAGAQKRMKGNQLNLQQLVLKTQARIILNNILADFELISKSAEYSRSIFLNYS